LSKLIAKTKYWKREEAWRNYYYSYHSHVATTLAPLSSPEYRLQGTTSNPAFLLKMPMYLKTLGEDKRH